MMGRCFAWAIRTRLATPYCRCCGLQRFARQQRRPGAYLETTYRKDVRNSKSSIVTALGRRRENALFCSRMHKKETPTSQTRRG